MTHNGAFCHTIYFRKGWGGGTVDRLMIEGKFVLHSNNRYKDDRIQTY